MSGGYLEGDWKVSGGCLEGVEDAWQVPGRCLERVKEVLESIKNHK